MKRAFDILMALTGIVLLSPLLLIIYLMIVCTSKGGGFYRQQRVGRYGKMFSIIKFRSMYAGAERAGRLTVSDRDERITTVGRFLRRYKLDELPQLFNVLIGDMSIVGPRPEVPEYVRYYTDAQRRVLEVRPGITDYASIEFADESNSLSMYDDPHKAYVEDIMPAKLQLNLKYINEQGLLTDLAIILKTFRRIVKGGR